MRTVSYRLGDLARATINIGKVAENEYTRVQFNAEQIFAEYPAATAALSVINPAGTAYPAVVTREGNLIIWDVTDADLTAEGMGELQLTLTENGVVIKSYIARTRIERSIVASGSTPDPVQNWLDEAAEVLEEVQEAIPAGGTQGQVMGKLSDDDYDIGWIDQTGGGGGTSNYNDLNNKPQIGGVTLSGNKTLHDLGAAAEADIPDVSGFYTKPSGGIPASDIADGVIPTVHNVPAGGSANQVLAKNSGTDYDMKWVNQSGGGGGATIDDTAGEGDTDVVWSADKTWTENEALKEAIAGLSGAVEYKFSGSDLLLGFGYSSTVDAVIVMNNGRANGLFDFAKFCTKTKGTSLKNLETADLTVVWTSSTDMHGPFQFLANSNADGYHSDAQSAGFTGGNHTLDGLGTGFETAESVYVNYYADGKPVSSGCNYCSKFEIRWANDVQAYNTVKQGGGGRSCLREYHDMIFDGEFFRERVTLKALEGITMSLWYGLQGLSVGDTYTKIEFVDATNRGTFASTDNDIKSGNTTTSGIICYGDNHRIEIGVDTNIDLGKRTYYSGDKGAFKANNKVYFFIVNQSTSMSEGAKYYLDGSFRFLPVIPETKPEPPTETLTLNKSSITVEKVGDTDTLTATHEPSSASDTFTWSSSDTNVATVDSSGVVTVKGIGTATITVTCGQLTATATVTQSSIKAPYDLKTVAGKYPNEYSPTGTDYNILAMATITGQNTVGQAYHNDDELRILYAATDDLEAIKVPYGATTVKIKTSDDVAVSISYWYLLDTTDIVTYSSKNLPKEISKTTWFNTNTGGTVEYGQAVVFRPTDAQLPTLSYVYFE